MVLLAKRIKGLFFKLFQVKQRVVRSFGYPNQFIEFNLNCRSVAVLRVLNQEDHQERDDSCACIDYKLPCIAELEYWTSDDPYSDHCYSEGEGSWTPAEVRGRLGESGIPGGGGQKVPVLTANSELTGAPESAR